MSESELKDKEAQAGQHDDLGVSPDERQAETEELETLYNNSPDNDEIPYNPGGDKGGRFPRLRARINNPDSKLNKRIGVAALGTSGIAILALLFLSLYIVNGLKLQNLAAHITEQNFTRLFRDNQAASEDIMAESLGKDLENEANKTLVGSLKEQYGDLRSSTWGKLDAFRPQKVLDNMHSTNQIEYVYTEVERGFLPGNKLVLSEVRIGGTSVPIPDQKLGRFISNAKGKVAFDDEASAAFREATPETLGIVRSRAYAKLRSSLGIKPKLWERAVSYVGESPEEALKRQQQEIAEQTYKGSSTQDTKVNETKKGAEETQAKIEEVIHDGAGDEFEAGKFKQSLESAKSKYADFQDSIRTSIESTLGEQGANRLLKVLEGASLTYKVTFPACLIYDGSVTNNAGPIDDKSRALQTIANQVLAGSDQVEKGDTVAEARGAYDLKLGNISASLPERRARGEIVDTGTVLSGPDRPQAGGNGSLSTDNVSILSAFLGGSKVVSTVDSVLETTCPTITDPKFLVADVALQVVITALTGGTSAGPEASAEAGIEAATTVIAEKAGATAASEVTGEVVSQALQKTASQKVKGFLFRIGAQTAALGGLEFLAKSAVNNRVNGTYVGLDGGSDYATEAAVGADLNMNESERQIMFGRPFTFEEIDQNDARDSKYVAQKNSQKSVFNRYVAASNPNSLLTISASWALGKKNTVFQSGQVSKLITGLFKNVGSLFANVLTRPLRSRVFAEEPIDRHSGIVQWGWSVSEDNLIKNDASYGVLSNAEYWEHAVSDDQKQQIEEKYGGCFTETIGTLLKEHKITRDESGAITGGDCSPENLGVNNRQGFDDLVFRYRLLNRNNNALDSLSDIQNADTSL